MTSSPTPLSRDSRPTSDLHTPRATPNALQREDARHVAPEPPHDSLLTSALPASPAEPRSNMGLTVAGVAGSSLAAVSSALAASFLGVAGTIAGALVGSLVGTVGTAVYSHSLQTASTRLRALSPSQKLAPVETSGQPSSGAREVHGALRSDQPSRRRPLLMIATGVAVAFAIAIGAITLAETVLGHPVSSSSGSGTTIGRAVTPQGSGSEPSGTTPSPAATTSTTGQTAPPTGVTTPVPTTATGSATGTTTSSASGSATDTGSSTTPAPSGSASTQVPATP